MESGGVSLQDPAESQAVRVFLCLLQLVFGLEERAEDGVAQWVLLELDSKHKSGVGVVAQVPELATTSVVAGVEGGGEVGVETETCDPRWLRLPIAQTRDRFGVTSNRGQPVGRLSRRASSASILGIAVPVSHPKRAGEGGSEDGVEAVTKDGGCGSESTVIRDGAQAVERSAPC